MKNFIKLMAVAVLLALAFVPVCSAQAEQTEVEAKTEEATAAKTEAEATPTVREGMKFVDLSAEDIYRAARELRLALESQASTEAEVKAKIPHVLKVEEDLRRLEGGTAIHKEVGAALKRGIVSRASGVDEAELRLGTPRTGKHMLRHAAAEAELQELLNPTMWDKLKWWWNG